MSRAQPEFAFQCALVRHVQARLVPGVYYTALPFGEYRTKATAGRLKAMGVRSGPGDLFFLRRGLPIMVELKVRPNGQSPEQKRFQCDWERAGGEYYLIFTMEDALRLLVNLEILRPDVSERAAAA